jgi:hypothetical protein
MNKNINQWATGAEMTATMIVWPKRCGHGGLVLELMEHFRPYWLTRRAGASVSARIREPGMALSAGLGLAAAPPPGRRRCGHPSSPMPQRHVHERPSMAGRHVTLLRYAGCILNDAEVDAARQGGVQLEVVDLQSNTSTDRNGK